MASRGDIKAGSSFIRLFLKDDMTGKLRTVMRGVATVAAPVAAAAAAAGTTLAGMMANFVKVGSDINDMAGRTGAAVGQLQELSFAAKQTGASAADLEVAMKSMVRKGFRVQDFESVGASIAAIRDPTERTAAALETFGKAGTKLLPMFADLNSLRGQSRALGPILTEDEVAMADALGDSFGAMTEAVSRAMNQIAASFGPQLKSLMDTAIGGIVKFSRLLSETNSFGSGGDWLDKAAEFLRTPFAELQSIGAAGTASVAGGRATPFAGASEEAEKASGKAKDNWADVMRQIDRAHQARNSLIAEFDTPAEKFLKKQHQINQAMTALHRNRTLGFVSKGDADAQLQGLRNAMVRLQGEEMRRRMGNRPEVAGKQVVEAKDQPEIIRNAISTFSAAGAFAMQGSGSVATKTLDEIRASRKHLAEIARMSREAAARRERPGLFKA